MPPTAQPASQAAAKAFNTFNLASFTIGAEAVNVINVAVQLKDAKGKNLYQRAIVRAYLADAATGVPITATAPTSTLAIGTNGSILDVMVTDKMLMICTDATGRFDLNITQTATPTYYLVVEMPDGSLVVSGAIAFA